ncbi:hypothetical protein ABH942_000967 [Flavobacterium sp. 28YEA47A]|uniref:hypothetical protein n=1 Tax=Flavobacterium sp. 28YEA47A TaxID=3156276 RepID=UPI0035177861
MKVFYLLLLFSFTAYSQESQFEYFETDVQDKQWFIKLEKVNNGHWEFWIKIVHPSTKTKNKKGQYVTKKGNYAIEFCELDCNNSTYSISDFTIYNSKGVPIDKGNSYEFNKRIVPETMMDLLKNHLCE